MRSKWSEKFSKVKIMSALAEAFGIAWCLKKIQPEGLGGKNYIPRIAREIGASARRAKALIYGEARRVDADEMSNLRAVGTKHVTTFELLADRLEAVDPEFHRAEIDRLRWHADHLRRLAR